MNWLRLNGSRSSCAADLRINSLVKALQATPEQHEELTEKLQSDNRRLSQQLKQVRAEGHQDLRKLRTGLADMQRKYHELEEQFLYMKLK